MSNSVLGKTMKSIRKHWDINYSLRNYLVSEPNYHTTRSKMYWQQKIDMYEFWYDQVKPKYNRKAKKQSSRYL